MLDPNFDPLEILQQHANQIATLIHHHNRQDSLLVDLSQQHQQVISLIRTDREKIVKLENKLAVLEQMVQDLYE